MEQPLSDNRVEEEMLESERSAAQEIEDTNEDEPSGQSEMNVE